MWFCNYSRTTAACVALTPLLSGIGGCTTFSPQLQIPERQSTLVEADRQLQTAIEKLQSGQQERNSINAAMGIGTLLGAAGAALSPVFKGTRDLTVGLAAFGASSYTVGSIYGGKLVPAVYSNGIDALLCVSKLSGPTKDLFQKTHSLNGTLAGAQAALFTRLNILKCTSANGSGGQSILASCPAIPDAQLTKAKAAAGAAEQALEAANIRFAGEVEVAGQVSDAVRGILNEVNKQVQAALPDAAAIQRLASGVSTAALAVPTTPTSGTASGTISGQKPLNNPPPKPEDPELTIAIDGVNTAVAAMNSALTPIPALHTDSCKVSDQPVTAAMATNAPASLDLKVDSLVQNFKITGGNGAYSTHWIGDEPVELIAAMQGDTLKILVNPRTKPADFGGKSYQLDVYDSTPGTPKHLPNPIKVNTLKPTP